MCPQQVPRELWRPRLQKSPKAGRGTAVGRGRAVRRRTEWTLRGGGADRSKLDLASNELGTLP